MADNISVCVRVRPLNERELKDAQNLTWKIENNSIYQCTSIGRAYTGPIYTFDNVFDPDVDTRTVYETVARDKILATLDGFNVTIFAYGQTSSGKTFTMHGSPEHPGVIPMGVSDIFTAINERSDRLFLLRISYLEIYNENIKDLLNTENDHLKIHEDIERGVYVGGLSEEIVTTAEEVLSRMQLGEKNRHVGSTNMNERSSRSHTIFRMVVESKSKDDEEGGAVKVSALHLVDLAGSERVSSTGAEGQRLKEGGHINKSLLVLGNVISKLSDGREQHIPYRDSKLTRILQPALGGNAKTAIICAMTSAARHCEETHSTLKFASRAKMIQNKAQMNEVVTDEAMVKKYQREIQELKKQLASGVNSSQLRDLQSEKRKAEEDREMMEKRLKEEESTRQKLEEKLRKLTGFALLAATGEPTAAAKKKAKAKAIRRETWAPKARGLDGSPLPDQDEIQEIHFDHFSDSFEHHHGLSTPTAGGSGGSSSFAFLTAARPSKDTLFSRASRAVVSAFGGGGSGGGSETPTAMKRTFSEANSALDFSPDVRPSKLANVGDGVACDHRMSSIYEESASMDSEMAAAIQALEAEKSELRTLLGLAEEHKDALTCQIKELSEKITKLEDDNLKMKSELDFYFSNTNANCEIGTDDNNEEELRAQLKSAQIEAAQAKRQVASLQEQLSNARHQHSEEIKNYQGAVERLSKDEADAARITKQKLSEKDQQIASLQKELERRAREASSWRGQSDALGSQGKKLLDDCTSLSAQLAEAHLAIDSNAQRLTSEFENKQKKAAETIASLQEKVETLEKQVSKTQKRKYAVLGSGLAVAGALLAHAYLIIANSYTTTPLAL